MKYKITLNGKTYEIEVEQGRAQLLGTADAPSAPEVPKPAAAPAPVTGAGEALPAPMPGAIIDIKVSAGDAVKKGQVLLILEAMKMENEVVSPRDAVVTKVAAEKGSTVAAGDPLVWLG